jgi:hypothetical protein
MNLNSEIAFYSELRPVDKVAERLLFNAYHRVLHGFESYDTTVMLGS